ncbi:uncharacterized protein LOC111832532 [Capsella rubella]|uniref:uncharacterized protein LOC111832532 n=1 Tax=Capsella rubella TaxID=81985 RepID=UPI000CD56EE4|nr:uncharacterized protein LOC111832532 [Capsella rubella]
MTTTDEYEICSDPFDPKCVGPCTIYRPGAEPEGAKRFLEKFRGKEEDMIHNYTRDEEYYLIREQIKKSQGFDVDFSMFRTLFDFYPSILDESHSRNYPWILDESHSTMNQETGRDYFGRLAKEAIARYNDRDRTSFEVVEVKKAYIYKGSRYTYFITFVVKNPCDDDNQTKIFQAKVRNVLGTEIVHSFCRQKPDQQVKC